MIGRNGQLMTEPQGRHGIYDLSGMQLSQHARQRVDERFAGVANPEALLVEALRAGRKLGTSQHGAEAYLVLLHDVPMVLIVMDRVILTALTPDQFETVMTDFGRMRWPGKPGRWYRRIQAGAAVDEKKTK